MSALVELREAGGKLSAARAEITALFGKKNADGRLDWSKEDGEKFEALEKQAGELQKEYKKWEAIEAAARENDKELEYLRSADGKAPIGDGRQPERRGAYKSAGRRFVESAAFRNFLAHGKSGTCAVDLSDVSLAELKLGEAAAEFKTQMTTSAGFLPFSIRTSDVVPFAFRTPVVADLMPAVTTGENAILYMEETTHTANAAPTAEVTALPESAIVYTQRTVNIEDVGTSLPVSDRMLDDAPLVAGLLDTSLGEEVARAEETQLLSGNGTSPQLAGFLNKSGVQTQAMGGDDPITAAMKAMVLVESVGFARPSAIVIHPQNWQTIVTLKTTSGRFIFGDPSQSGPRTLWGLPAVVTVAITQNTALVGDFRLYAYVGRRMGLRIEMGYVNTDFTQRQKTIRAYERVALVIRRPSAFCTVTGLS